MVRPSWNHIQDSAVEFATRWKGETRERGEAQSFWNEFLALFGIDRRRAGVQFEFTTARLKKTRGYVDLFWPGMLIVEHKSAGRDLEDARAQAADYLAALTDDDLPLAVVVSDFATFKLFILPTDKNPLGERVDFTLEELPKNVQRFGFLFKESRQVAAAADPVNQKAAEEMAKLHNDLEKNKYVGKDLELLLVRLVFCLFADDSLIFERGAFARFIEQRTHKDGSDLGPRLIELFEVLNTPPQDRQLALDEDLKTFPYINGGLFKDQIKTPAFTETMRLKLIFTARLDWELVSPAIFGSMFQGVMSEEERHLLGAHYTSETNILRVIKPLFLDDLYTEFDSVRDSQPKLEAFHDKLATLTFLDPACGCGNFLAITYRELRRLEHKVVQHQFKGQTVLNVRELLKVNVDQMHGIEIEEFPSRVAETALWLVDHQMNNEASRLFGRAYARLPLTASAHIVHANALRIAWEEVVPASQLSFIVGNPPFAGSRTMSPEQKADLKSVTKGLKEEGFLDLVAGWYFKALASMKNNPEIKVALVSTNSITQGEQVGILWEPLIDAGVHIDFAHRTFKWSNEAPGGAAVYCVIVGFSLSGRLDKTLYEYSDVRGEPIEVRTSQINPYLVDAPNVFVRTRQTPISPVLPMNFGNMPADKGNLLLNEAEAAELRLREPQAIPHILPLISAREFIKRIPRYCLWLKGIEPSVIRSMPLVYARVLANRAERLKSSRPKLANVAAEFAQITQDPSQPFVLIPRHSSETREYVPMGIFPAGNVAHDSCMVVKNAEPFYLAVLSSRMHMAWMKAVCGRLESRYRYSKDIVYNNFPWPDMSTKDREKLDVLAQVVIDARDNHPKATLADLYDPVVMPADLRAAHDAVDRYVDRLYQSEPFTSDEDRVGFLFARYAKLVAV